MRQKSTAIVNVYDMVDQWNKFRVLSFEKENEAWIDFVCGCRKGEPLNKERVLDELRYHKMNDQICIVNQEALDQLVTFRRAYEAKNHDR